LLEVEVGFTAGHPECTAPGAVGRGLTGDLEDVIPPGGIGLIHDGRTGEAAPRIPGQITRIGQVIGVAEGKGGSGQAGSGADTHMVRGTGSE